MAASRKSQSEKFSFGFGPAEENERRLEEAFQELEVGAFLDLIYVTSNERPQVCDDKFFAKILSLFDAYFAFPQFSARQTAEPKRKPAPKRKQSDISSEEFQDLILGDEEGDVDGSTT